MRIRRTFTKEFKTEIANKIINKTANIKALSKEYEISEPLLQRWVNDFIASTRPLSVAKMKNEDRPQERRKDYQTTQELKARIADLYMYIERLQKQGLTYSAPRPPEKEA